MPRPASLSALAHRNGRSSIPIAHLTTETASDNSIPLLGNEAQALIECNQKLKELGIDETITLPQICVIGDQSTGKSSLIEAISNIQVPKAAGCCTQCPIAINLSSGPTKTSPRTCTVYIEKKYDYVASMANKVTKLNPLGPWQERDAIDLIALPTTSKKDDVAHLIRVAQAAILDPDKGPAYYLSSHEALQDATQVARFSPNVVRLDISEGDWPSLSFIDLPGVIANAGRVQDKYLVELIKNLVQKYAYDQRSINMLTLPMNHDIDNCQAFAIIQELEVEDRTLAVFTKSDLASQDQKEQILARFNGTDQIIFKHGYHSVMMPDKVSLEQAKEYDAEQYRQKPWCDLPSAHRSRLGISSLSQYLRRLLFEKTAEALPGNLRAIEARLEEVQEQLSQLPNPLDTTVLPYKLQQELAKFEKQIHDLFSAAHVRKAWNNRHISFRSKIANARPTMVLSTKAESKLLTEYESILDEPSAAAESGQDRTGATNDRIKVDSSGARISRSSSAHRFRLEDIRSINESVYSAFTQAEIDPKAVDEMNKRSVKSWDHLLFEHMNACREMLQKQIENCFDKVFASLQHLEIHPIMKSCVDDHVNKVLEAEFDHAAAVCVREQERPFTLDSDTLKAKEGVIVEELRRKRLDYRIRLTKAKMDAEEGYKRPKCDPVKDGTLQPDPHDREVQMAAKTRAYYEIASCRFTDIIGQSIEDVLRHDQIKRWMEQNPDIEATRRRLRLEERKLIEGLDYIKTALGYNGNPNSPSKRRLEVERYSPSASPSKKTKFDADLAVSMDHSQQIAGPDDLEMRD